MSCFKPLTAWKAGKTLRFKYPEAGTFNEYTEIKLPCRRCIGCRVDRETEWSVRMMHEAEQHKHNEFVTLTYDEDHLPWDNSLDHSHVQQFIRALRKKTKQKIRFYVAGEYGEQRSRPHYHLILFGLKLTDKIQVAEKSYRSALLTEVWGMGTVDIGQNVTRASCVYVAGYMLKDSMKEWEIDFEWPNLITGEMRPRKPPYSKMSNRPGVGKAWYEKFGSDVFPNDFVVMDGKKHRSPQYYRRLLEAENPELFQELRKRRKEALQDEKYLENNTPERLAAREQFMVNLIGPKSSRSARKKYANIGKGKYHDKSKEYVLGKPKRSLDSERTGSPKRI